MKQLKDQSETMYYVLGKILGAGPWKEKNTISALGTYKFAVD